MAGGGRAASLESAATSAAGTSVHYGKCGEAAAESVHGVTSLRRVPGTGRTPDGPPLVRCAPHEYESVPWLSTGVAPMAPGRWWKRALVSKRKGMRHSHALAV